MNGWDRFATGGDSTVENGWVHNGSQRPGSQRPDQAQAWRHLGPAQHKRLCASVAAARHGRGGDGDRPLLTARTARRGTRSRGAAGARRCEHVGRECGGRECGGLCGGTPGHARGEHHELRPGERRDASRHYREASDRRAASAVRATCGRRAANILRGCGRKGSRTIFGCGPRDPRPCRHGERAIGNARGRGPASSRGHAYRCSRRVAGRHAVSGRSWQKQAGTA